MNREEPDQPLKVIDAFDLDDELRSSHAVESAGAMSV